MSLESRITALAERIAAQFNALGSGAGLSWRTFQVRNTDTTHNLNVSTAWTEVPIAGTVDAGADTDFQVFGNGIQTLSARKVKATVSIKTTATVARANYPVKFYVNGFAQEGTGASGYIRNASGHTEGSVHLTRTLSLAAGAIVTVRTQREGGAGTVTMDAGESILLLEAFD